VDGDGAGLEGERGAVGAANPIAHAGSENGLDPGHQAEEQRNEEQASLEVARSVATIRVRKMKISHPNPQEGAHPAITKRFQMIPDRYDACCGPP
jgi:hypothetical protein